MRALELKGQRFGRLTIIKRSKFNKGTNITWECLCDCGNITIVPGTRLKRGSTQSCGCYQSERASAANIKHSHSLNSKMSPTYGCWCHMKTRCLNPNYPLFNHYGGRGITFCKRWEKFENFLKDMGNRPKGKYSLERKDVNGNYEPDNCCWIPLGDQAHNTTRTVMITYKGVTKCMSVWARELNINYDKLKYRRRKGIPFNKIVEELRGDI